MERWWDGQQWLGNPRPLLGLGGAAAVAGGGVDIVEVGAILLAVIGTFLQFQTVTLSSGSGIIWIGAGMALAGTVVIFVKHMNVALRVICFIALAFCVVNVVYVEHQLSDRRQQLQQIFNSP